MNMMGVTCSTYVALYKIVIVKMERNNRGTIKKKILKEILC